MNNKRYLVDLHCTQCGDSWKARVNNINATRKRVCKDCQEEINDDS